MNKTTDESIIINDGELGVYLITESEAKEEFQEATSATTTNPAVTWAKFVLTDDKPNFNKQRIPIEEFPNLIKSGVYMPIKMARGEIKDGHEVAEPLGVITNLKSVSSPETGNQIIGLAALWLRERPEDINLLKTRSKKKAPITLSWEILYRDSSFSEEGVEDLKGTSLKASTIVGRPAYGNRTPILAIAAKGSSAYLDSLPDSAFLLVSGQDEAKERRFPFTDRDGNVDKELLASTIEEIENDTLEQELRDSLLAKATLLLKEEDLELKSNTEENKLDELETLKAELESQKAELAANKALVAEKEQALVEKEAELVTLREFKASIEAQASELEKLNSIKAKFADAGITKEETYFTEHASFLLGMSDEALDFMLQELVAFSTKAQEQVTTSSVVIPNLTSRRDTITNDAKTLAEALRSRK